MANTKSAAKRARQTTRRTARNKAVKTLYKSAVKTVREKIAAGDKEGALAAYRNMSSQLDRAARKGVASKNSANRRKSEIGRAVAAIAAS